jgi:putative PIN family toxin of toxin-antitoxin system
MLLINKKTRIILDTNLWISLLITKDSTLNKVLSIKGIQVLFSQNLLHELQAVATRPKFKKYFSVEKKEELLNKIKNIPSWLM